MKYKNSLLHRSGLIEQVTNPQELEQAREVVAEIKKAVNDVEKARVEWTAPFLATQRALKSKADEWRFELDEDIKALESLISGYIQYEHEKAAALQRAAEAEARRAREEQERAAREEQARIAELQRQREQVEMRALELKTRAAREKALINAMNLRKEQEALELERLERETEPVATIVAPAPVLETRGIQVRPTFEITVTDIHALYAWNRNFVTLEAKKGLLNSLVNDHDGEIAIPGVEIKKILKTNVRSAL